jgi:hypothetical protein
MRGLPPRSAPPTDLIGGSVEKATEAQVRYLRVLADEREWPANRDRRMFEDLLKFEGMTKAQASASIIEMKTWPRRREAAKADGWPELPDGRYALRFPEDDLNPVRFYKVSTGSPDSERWAGFRFVNRFVSDELFPVKGQDRAYVLNEINKDPAAASRLFGVESRACGVCGRRLTRRISRALGIGPVCAAKTGFVSDAYISQIRIDMIERGENPDETIED